MFNIGDVIRKKRTERGWRQPELARRAGVTVGTVSRLEDDPSRASADTLRRLAAALDTTVPDLYSALAAAPAASRSHQRELPPALYSLALEMEDLAANQVEAIAVLVRGMSKGRTVNAVVHGFENQHVG